MLARNVWQRLGMGNQGEGIVCGMLVYIVGLSMWRTGVLAWSVWHSVLGHVPLQPQQGDGGRVFAACRL